MAGGRGPQKTVDLERWGAKVLVLTATGLPGAPRFEPVIQSEADPASWFTQDGRQGACPVSNGMSRRPSDSLTVAQWAARVGGAWRAQAVGGTGRRPPWGPLLLQLPSPVLCSRLGSASDYHHHRVPHHGHSCPDHNSCLKKLVRSLSPSGLAGLGGWAVPGRRSHRDPILPARPGPRPRKRLCAPQAPAPLGPGTAWPGSGHAFLVTGLGGSTLSETSCAAYQRARPP